MPKKKAKRIKVVKVVPVAPEKTLVELEVEGPPPIPVEPLEVPLRIEEDRTHPVVKWLKNLW